MCGFVGAFGGVRGIEDEFLFELGMIASIAVRMTRVFGLMKATRSFSTACPAIIELRLRAVSR